MTEIELQSYNLRAEMADDRRLYLNELLVVTLLAGTLAAGLHLMGAGLEFNPLPWLALGAGVLAGFSLLHTGRQELASRAYIGGLVVWLALLIRIEGIESGFVLLSALPFIASWLLQERDAMLPTWVATFGGMFIGALGHTLVGGALVYVLPPAVVFGIFAAALYAKEGAYLAVASYAVDIQRKDTRRAEDFYAQKLQLEEAFVQIRHTKSELEWANARLSEAQQEAERASQAKSVFLSNMSHELRTPLNVVIGYSSSMLSVPQMFNNVNLPEVYRPYVKLIEDNGHYLLGLINDILDLSKIEAGKLELHPGVVDLPDMFRGVLATSIGLVKNKPLQLRPDFPADLPPVWGDGMRVRQVLLNLMSNAIKFTATGSVTLSARLEGNQVRIAVTDTGIGIPEKALASIFDRFEQAEQDTERRYGGTGLGLDISKRLAVMHGSDLKVESVVNQGSTFSFTLPLATAEQVANEHPAEDLSSSLVIFQQEPTAPAVTYSVLLAVDDTASRTAYEEALEALGFAVVDASGDLPVVDLAAGLLPDVIVLDSAEGEATLRAIREDDSLSLTPVLICAATEPILSNHQDDFLYVPSPMTVDILLSCVQHLTQRQTAVEKVTTAS